MLDKIRALVKSKEICVLATVSEGMPHCSLMAYAVNKECNEIYMVTHKQTTKYRNLVQNPCVSLLIDTREEHASHKRLDEAQAITVDGVFEKLVDQTKRQAARSLLLARHPHLEEFLDHPDAEILSIRISSFLFLNGIDEAYYEEL